MKHVHTQEVKHEFCVKESVVWQVDQKYQSQTWSCYVGKIGICTNHPNEAIEKKTQQIFAFLIQGVLVVNGVS